MVDYIAAAVLMIVAGVCGAAVAGLLATPPPSAEFESAEQKGRRIQQTQSYTWLCALAFAFAPLGVFSAYHRLVDERAEGYLWSEGIEHSDAPALYYRVNESDWPVQIRDGMLRYDSKKSVPPGVKYHGEYPPHLQESGGEPSEDPRF
jgi:hypothetical protein